MARSAQRQAKKSFDFEGRFNKVEPVLDADFEMVSETESGRHAATPGYDTTEKSSTEKPDSDKIGMSVFAKKPSKPLADDKMAFYGLGACLVALSFWVSGGYSLFRTVDMMPVASITSAHSSEIADASWRVVTVDGRSALHVEGIVRNSGSTAVHTKPVTVTVKHGDGSTKRYLLGQKGWTLGPGQEVVVSGRLDILSSSIASVVIALTE